MSFCYGVCEFFVGRKQNVVVFIPAFIRIEIGCAAAHCVEFDGADNIIERAKRLAARIIVIFLCNG